MKAEGYLNGLKQNAGGTEVILYASAETARAVGYNQFMPSYPYIEEYRAKLQELIEFGGSDNEENIHPAFQNCLDAYCHDHLERLVLIPELKASPGNKPDGTVKDSLRMARGYWGAKDSHDDLDAEIKVKFNRGYPRDNIIFEDSQTAVLVQNGNEAMRVDMSRDGELHRLIRIFLDYELPEIQEFRHAQSQFKTDLPTVLENLRATVADAESENERYQEAASSFLDLCRRTIGPAVSQADVREMLLQHILTKDIFQRVFSEDQFHRENNIARQLDGLEGTFFTGDVRRQAIDRLRTYYGVIGRAADEIADYSEKQQFLKAIYEDFYTAYNPAAADRLGVVYTPNEVVDFIIRGADHLLQKHFGKTLADDNVQILDPATGTGTFITNLINHLPADRLEHKYRQRNPRQRSGHPALLHRQPEHRVHLPAADRPLPGVPQPVLRGYAGQPGLAAAGSDRRRRDPPGVLQLGRPVRGELDPHPGAEREAHQRHHRQSRRTTTVKRTGTSSTPTEPTQKLTGESVILTSRRAPHKGPISTTCTNVFSDGHRIG